VSYIKPEEVRSPRASWQLIDVLLDRGEGDCAYALGEWDGERRIGFRWNGTEANPIGNPQSRGLPTWTMLDPEMHEAVIAMLPADKQTLARRHLGTQFRFDGVSLDDRRLALWDLRQMPPVVVAIPCDAMKDAIGQPEITDEASRLVADRNSDLIATVAERKFARREYRTADTGFRMISLTLDDLQPIASQLETEVLRIAAGFRWAG